jgi:hypothetical protein
MKRTNNYNLKKPSQTDHYDVEHFNENADIIDETLQQHEAGKEPVRAPATDAEADTGTEPGIRAWSPQRIRRAMRDGARTGLLTGLASQTGELAAADTILTALGKAMGRINLKAPLASPALTGTPTAPTPAATTNNTQIATTAFAQPRLSVSNNQHFRMGDNVAWPASSLTIGAALRVTHQTIGANQSVEAWADALPGAGIYYTDITLDAQGGPPPGGGRLWSVTVIVTQNPNFRKLIARDWWNSVIVWEKSRTQGGGWEPSWTPISGGATTNAQPLLVGGVRNFAIFGNTYINRSINGMVTGFLNLEIPTAHHTHHISAVLGHMPAGFIPRSVQVFPCIVRSSNMHLPPHIGQFLISTDGTFGHAVSLVNVLEPNLVISVSFNYPAQ